LNDRRWLVLDSAVDSMTIDIKVVMLRLMSLLLGFWAGFLVDYD
jgi:hypothetical protein